MAETTEITAPATRPAGSGLAIGLMPTTIDDAWRLAKFLAASTLVPEDFRGKPENCLVALQLGAEVGFPPMQALQSIAVINGRPSLWGDGFLALLINSPKYRSHEEYYEVGGERRDGLFVEDWNKPDAAAVCVFWRTDREAPIVGKFTVAQAKRAGLLSKKGPWQEYPERMLKLRARSWAGRDAFPDVLRGLVTREEALDRREVIEAEPIEPRRKSAMPAPAPIGPPIEPAAPVPATPAVPASTASGQQIRGLRIRHTAFVKPKQPAEPYYQITALSISGKDRQFITRNEAVYKEAASFEGTDHPVALIVEAEGRDLVITDIAIDEGPGLFESEIT